MPKKVLSEPLKPKSPNPILFSIVTVFITLVLFIFTVILGIGSINQDSGNQLPGNEIPINNSSPVASPLLSTYKPQTEYRLNNGTYACGKGSDAEVQDCCQQWADANEIITSQCLGSWSVSNVNKCYWQCSTTQDSELTFEEDLRNQGL